MEKAYKNLGYVLLLFIPLTLLAFFPTYFYQFPSFEASVTGFVHIHAIIASIWIVMLIAQPLLIKNRKFALHKKVGRMSYVLFPLLILSFLPQMHRIINSDTPIVLFFPLADSLSLVLFYSLAIYHRKIMAKHMRYMIGTAIVFLGPTIGRIGPKVLGLSEELTQNLQYGIIYLILVGLIFLDRKNGKDYKPYVLILSTWIIHQIVFNTIF